MRVKRTAWVFLCIALLITVLRTSDSGATTPQVVSTLNARLDATSDKLTAVFNGLMNKRADEVQYADKAVLGSLVLQTSLLAMETEAFVSALNARLHGVEPEWSDRAITAIDRKADHLEALLQDNPVFKPYLSSSLPTKAIGDSDIAAAIANIASRMQQILTLAQKVTDNYPTKFSSTMSPFDGWRIGADDYGIIHIPPMDRRVHCVAFPFDMEMLTFGAFCGSPKLIDVSPWTYAEQVQLRPAGQLVYEAQVRNETAESAVSLFERVFKKALTKENAYPEKPPSVIHDPRGDAAIAVLEKDGVVCVFFAQVVIRPPELASNLHESLRGVRCQRAGVDSPEELVELWLKMTASLRY